MRDASRALTADLRSRVSSVEPGRFPYPFGEESSRVREALRVERTENNGFRLGNSTNKGSRTRELNPRSRGIRAGGS